MSNGGLMARVVGPSRLPTTFECDLRLRQWGQELGSEPDRTTLETLQHRTPPFDAYQGCDELAARVCWRLLAGHGAGLGMLAGRRASVPIEAWAQGHRGW